MHYFDYAATTPLAPVAREALLSQLDIHWHNPSAQYPMGLANRKALEQYRETIARAVGCKAEEFHFTSGGTESNNWAIFQGASLGRQQGNHLITSSLEHHSVLESFNVLESQGKKVTYLSPDDKGEITLENVLSAIQEDTAFISLMAVNNETGIQTAVNQIARGVKARFPRILIHSDGVQGFLKSPLSTDGLDFLSVSGHKLFAPVGVGGLYVRSTAKIKPLLYGGGQEGGLRSGTEPLPQIAAFASVIDGWEERLGKTMETKGKVIHALSAVEGVKLCFSDAPTASHIIPISLVGYASEVVLRFLGEHKIYLSAGSACHRGGKSHVYEKMPLSSSERFGILRISISHLTTEENISALVNGLNLARDNLCFF
ncbi:MAG: cysteine desulfurase family protein [Eubacteriales bacterium]